MKTDLISDFWTYCQCYEIPRNYAIWSAMSLLSSTINRKCYIKQGDISHSCCLYVCLVGAQGNKKSTPMWFTRNIYHEAFPDIPIGSSVSSRESIVRYMASEEGARYFTNHEKVTVEYHPYMLFVNEFENFLSYNIPGMVSFLVDIYDVAFFDSSTIVRGLEAFPNPAVNMLACCIPSWLINKLKTDIITGGICRRIIFVYEFDAKDDAGKLISIPIPTITPAAYQARERVKAHIRKVDLLRGEFTWEPAAQAYFIDWYHENKRTLPDDALMQGYRRTKDIQLLKTAMCVCAAEYEPKLVLTLESIMLAQAYLESIEPNMPKLSVAAGRNELAGPQQAMLELLSESGGWMLEIDLMRRMEKELNPAQQQMVFLHLKQTEQIIQKRYKHRGIDRMIIFTKECYMQHKDKTEIPPKAN